MTAIIDTNVIIAALDPAHEFHDWSVNALEEQQAEGAAVIPDIVYCEVSMGMRSKAELDEAVEKLALERLATSDEALIRAGLVYLAYRANNKGQFKGGVLPDFLIGAMAEVEEATLVTANSKDYVGYFPALTIVTPQN